MTVRMTVVAHGREMQLRTVSFLTLITLAACGDEANPHRPHSVSEPARALVEAFVPQSDEVLRARVDGTATRRTLLAYVDAQAARPWNDRLDGGIKYADLFQALYGARPDLNFCGVEGLNERGRAVVETLKSLEAHDLATRYYHLQRIEKLDRELSELAVAPPTDLRLRGGEAELAVGWLREAGVDNNDEAARGALADAILGDDSFAPRLADVASQRRTALRPVVERVAELEVRVADAALRAARDLRLFNYRRVSWKDLSAAGGGKKLIYRRLEEAFDRLADARPEEIADVYASMEVPHEQYRKLVTALQTYQTIESTGGWKEVAPFPLGPDAPASSIAALETRLASEGYIERRDQPAWDATLEAAVHDYQATHQFAQGAPTAGFWRSLNVSAADRIAQIRLALTRWRESYFEGEPDFIFVNIPDFHAEVYREGERVMRFRVVVGNTDRVCNAETGRWEYPNATPIQWGELDHLMLNPWWNVPDRLFREEIEPRMHDEAWLAEKGYEIYRDGTTLRARQRPGEANALGRVKFIFPNPHNTFLHDTPSKKFFEYPTRAYSHGCVRVHEPLELAEHLMTEYDHGGRERLDKILEIGSTIRVEFEPKIPVYFEYHTVRVDEAGRVHFLADPYDLDAKELATEPIPSCVAPVAKPQSIEVSEQAVEEAEADTGP